MLNIIWAGFFIVSFMFACFNSYYLGDVAIWGKMVVSIFDSAKSAFNICINLTGILCLWLGLLKIAEVSGLTGVLSRLLMPLFKKIMPEVPSDSPALGSIVMNIAANILGLDNAATPMGLKAMEQLQEINPSSDTASKAQQLFMVINASSVTLIPITILMYRSELGASNPAAVFIPILLATSVSTMVGFLSIALVQKLNIFNRVVLAYLIAIFAFVGLVAWYFISLPPELRTIRAATVGNFTLFMFIIGFIVCGLFARINVYEQFIEGAKEGFFVAIKIIPYLVAMLVAISALQSSGVLDIITLGFNNLFSYLGMDTDFVAAMPTAILKPLSGSGARAMMIETLRTYGADSFQGFVSSVIQGSTETTFYVLAVYFGVVRINKVGAALPCALLADLAGIIAAIYFSYIFF